MNWNEENFKEFIINNDIIGFFKEPIKLKSGRLSYWYVNWRNVAEDVFSLDQLTDFLISFVINLGLEPDCFYGVPEGATKLGILTQFKWAKSKNLKKGSHILPMGRAKPKEHGDPKDKYFLGVPKGKVVILEDVTTTGGSLLETIDKLKQLNIEIIAAIGLTNRNELRDDKKSVEQIVSEKGIKYHAMSNAFDLIPKVFNKLQPGEEIAKQIENYFREYCVKEINLL